MPKLSKRLLESHFVSRFGGFIVSKIATRWMGTLDYQAAYYDLSVDVAREEFRGPVIYLLWHEYLLTPFITRRHTGLGMLASRHRDAEVLAQAGEFGGFKCFRGSSGSGGTRALLEIIKRPDINGLVVTPDGPRGPRRTVASGAIFMASRMQVPLVPLGVGMDRPYRYQRSWDKFAMPRVHSRVRLIVGPRIEIPYKLGRERLEEARESVERSLTNLSNAAERWAESTAPHENSAPFYSGPFHCIDRIRHQRPGTLKR